MCIYIYITMFAHFIFTLLSLWLWIIEAATRETPTFAALNESLLSCTSEEMVEAQQV